MCAGVASVTVLAVYGVITGTATVNHQSVLVDGKDIASGSGNLAYTYTGSAANTIIGLHTLENTVGSPATIGFNTTCSNLTASENDQTGNNIIWSDYPHSDACDGITTGYMKWNTPTSVLAGGQRPSVIYDGDHYEMWYLDGSANIKYAESSNGTTWETIQDTNVPKANDAFSVTKEDGVYYMINYGSATTFDIYNSPDGLAWTDQGVIYTFDNTGTFKKIDNPKLLKNSDGTYNLYFQAKTDETTISITIYDIFLATTTKTSLSDIADVAINDFTGQADVLSPGASGTWDDFRVMHPRVIKEGDQYIIMYVGYSVADTSQKIGYAVSDNGVDFTKVNVSTSGYDTTLGTGSAKPSLVNANGDIVLFYMNGSDINETTLTPVVLDGSNKMTLQSGEVKGFFVENEFKAALAPDTYTIVTEIVPAE